MTNPFESPSATYCVLLNKRGQHSLWPDFISVPAGWIVVGPKGNCDACMRWIDEAWTEMYSKGTART